MHHGDCRNYHIAERPIRQAVGNERLEFFALPLIAEIGAALAGFATLAGVIGDNELDADSIFATVFNSLIAVIFAVLAILFLSREGTHSDSIRFLAAALLAASVTAIAREINVYRSSWRDHSKRPALDGLGKVFGSASLLTMPVSPLLSCAVISGVFSTSAALLYELAVFSHLAVAMDLGWP